MSRSFSPERKVLNEKFQLNGEFLGLVDPKLWLNLFLHVLPPYGCERVKNLKHSSPWLKTRAPKRGDFAMVERQRNEGF